MDKINRVQNMLDKFQQVVDKNKQDAEDVRQIPAGCGQDKQGAEHVRQIPAGCRQNKQDAEDVRQTGMQKMLDKFQQVVDKINRMQNMLGKEGAEDVRQGPAGCGQDKHRCRTC